MNGIRRGQAGFVARLALLASLFAASTAFAQRDSIPPDYPQSLEQDLQQLSAELNARGDDPADFSALLIRLAETYLNLGDDLYLESDRRQRAYEDGARTAQRALELRETDAEAHFLYAANLGSAAKMKGIASGALAVQEIKRHLQRAIELQPDHAPSLQMMGGLLAQLPWLLGGDTGLAEDYLKRAITADADYTYSHILLAQLYIKQERFSLACPHLQAVIQATRPHYPYTWRHRFKPEAEALLQALPAHTRACSSKSDR